MSRARPADPGCIPNLHFPSSVLAPKDNRHQSAATHIAESRNQRLDTGLGTRVGVPFLLEPLHRPVLALNLSVNHHPANHDVAQELRLRLCELRCTLFLE